MKNTLPKDTTMFMRLLCAASFMLATISTGQEASIRHKENIGNAHAPMLIRSGKRLASTSSPHTSPPKIQKSIDTHTALSLPLPTQAPTAPSSPAPALQSSSRIAPPKPPTQRHRNPFCRTMRTEIKQNPRPAPLFPKIRLTAAAEQKEGGRRWVQYLDSAKHDDNVQCWHRSMSEILECFQYISTQKDGRKDRYLSRTANIAIAQMEIHTQDSSVEYISLPYFFISGWPATAHRTSIQDLSQKLSKKELIDFFAKVHTIKSKAYAGYIPFCAPPSRQHLGYSLGKLPEYTLQFFSKSYKNGQESTHPQRQNYDQGSRGILRTLQSAKKLSKEIKIISDDRIQSHTDFLEKDDYRNGQFAKLYFHSEQSIWQRVYMHLKEWREAREEPAQVSHVIVDICSYYDMCWICADVGICSLQTQREQGWNIYVRCSGNHGYRDIHYHTSDHTSQFCEPRSLREQRKDFTGYDTSHAFNVKSEGYKPYIAHSMKEDWYA